MTDIHSKNIVLTDCDREPIHIPGSIQPHGIVLVTDLVTQIIQYGAGPVRSLLGCDEWIGQPLANMIGELAGKAQQLALATPRGAFIGSIERAGQSWLDVTAHIANDQLIIEIEPRAERSRPSTESLAALERAASSFEQSATLKELCEVAAVEFRKLTGYDRVMIYRFLDNAAGEVLAEDRRSGLSSFLNHHFPSSDIPQQARALYVRNLVRVIPDVSYTPAPLKPDWSGTEPLNMSDSSLRSVSPIHLQYLKNMGVAASASVSIVKDGDLWGLVACHNETPKTVAYDVRASCRVLAASLARHIKAKEQTDAYRERLRLRRTEDELIEILSLRGTLEQSLVDKIEDVRNYLGCDGFAILREDRSFTTGECPAREYLPPLLTWLQSKGTEGVFVTDRLSEFYQPAKAFESLAAGILAVPLPIDPTCFLVWFRAEEVQIVKWAGNPHKAVDLKPGEVLSPRASFEAWQDTVHGHSRRWTLSEYESAGRVRHAMMELRKNWRLRELNRQLTESVSEKDLLLEQKNFLIGEVNHRVQNSLQLVSSFLSLQVRESNDETFIEAIEEARRRITAVSLLHRRLYRGDQVDVVDGARYVEELCADLVKSMGSDWAEQITLDLAPVMFPTDRAVPLGLVLTELVINANKYAYNGASGPIHIALVEDRARFKLTVSDKGGGKTTERSGFGTKMMLALVGQLSGELDFQPGNPGLRVVLSAPITTRPGSAVVRD